MQKPDSENIELELEGMRYYYRMYPVGTLQISGLSGRQFPALQRDPGCAAPDSEPMAPILFVNGAWQQMEGWIRHAEYANRLAPVILLDPPGNGTADAAPAHYGLEFFESVVLQVLDAARVSRVNVLGFSYGTLLAFGLARSHPERVERVVLAGTMARLSDATREALRKAIRALRCGQADDFADIVLTTFACREADIQNRRLVDRLVRASLTRLAPADYWKYEQNMMRVLIHTPRDVSSLAAPTLVLTGEHDMFTPPAGGRELARACTRAAFTTIRQADHFSYLQNPRAVMDLALNFFRELPLDSVPDCAPIEYFGCDLADVREVA